MRGMNVTHTYDEGTLHMVGPSQLVTRMCICECVGIRLLIKAFSLSLCG